MIKKILASGAAIAIIVLAIMLAIQTKRLNKEKQDNVNSTASIKDLTIKLHFTENMLASFRIENGRLLALTRTTAGGKPTGHDDYVPPEGHVDITIGASKTVTGQVNTEQPQIHISITNKGFTFRIGYGFVYSKKLYPELDIKWAYWDRYSLKTGFTIDFADLAITRHVDDLIPWFNWQNLEAQVGGGLEWDGLGKRLLAGFRSNF